MGVLRQTAEAPSGHAGPQGTPGALEGGANTTLCLATTGKTFRWSPWPRAPPPDKPALHCHPRPVEGRFCARVVSRDPFLLQQATHLGCPSA